MEPEKVWRYANGSVICVWLLILLVHAFNSHPQARTLFLPSINLLAVLVMATAWLVLVGTKGNVGDADDMLAKLHTLWWYTLPYVATCALLCTRRCLILYHTIAPVISQPEPATQSTHNRCSRHFNIATRLHRSGLLVVLLLTISSFIKTFFGAALLFPTPDSLSSGACAKSMCIDKLLYLMTASLFMLILVDCSWVIFRVQILRHRSRLSRARLRHDTLILFWLVAAWGLTTLTNVYMVLHAIFPKYVGSNSVPLIVGIDIFATLFLSFLVYTKKLLWLRQVRWSPRPLTVRKAAPKKERSHHSHPVGPLDGPSPADETPSDQSLPVLHEMPVLEVPHKLAGIHGPHGSQEEGRIKSAQPPVRQGRQIRPPRPARPPPRPPGREKEGERSKDRTNPSMASPAKCTVHASPTKPAFSWSSWLGDGSHAEAHAAQRSDSRPSLGELMVPLPPIRRFSTSIDEHDEVEFRRFNTSIDEHDEVEVRSDHAHADLATSSVPEGA
eukprot:g41612.t1